MNKCKVKWCNCKTCISGKGYCRMHYDQIREYGRITEYRPAGRRNEYVNCGAYTELRILDSHSNIKAIATTDNEDVSFVSLHSWRMHNNGYVMTVVNGKTEYLHRLIVGKIFNNKEVDHINRNKLDNRRENLRICSHCINANNKSVKNIYGVRGIGKRAYKNKTSYIAQITYNNEHRWLGSFSSVEEAISARKKAEKLLNIQGE